MHRSTAAKLSWLAPLLLALVACSPNSRDLVESAKGLLDKGDARAAILQLKNALAEEPNRAELRFLMGTALLRSGDAAGALVELRKARDFGQPVDDVAPATAGTLVALTRHQSAIDEFAATQLTRPEAMADLKVTLATAYANVGQTDKVAPLIDEAFKLAPKLPSAMLAKAKLLAGQGDLDGALKLADAVAATGKLKAEIDVFRGDAFMRNGAKVDLALAAYQAALQADPTQVSAHIAVIGIELSRGNHEAAVRGLQAFRKALPKNPQVPYVEAQMAFISKDYGRAREILDQLLRAYPDIAVLRMFAGAAHLRLGSLLLAESNLAKAIQLDPKLDLARESLGRTYLKLGQPEKALAALGPAVSGPSPSPGALAVAGEAYLQSGNFRQAEAAFDQSLKLKPNEPSVRTAAALTQLSRGQADEAFKGLQTVAETDKGVTANLATISARMRRGEWAEALVAIDELERKQPKEPQAASLRGVVRLLQNDRPAARAAFEAALKLQPAHFPASRQLAAMDLADKQPDRARQRIEEALKANPKSADAQLILVDLRARAGADKVEIGKLLSAAAEANPTHAPTQLAWIRHLSETKERKRQLEAAQRAVTALPDNLNLLLALGDAQVASNDVQQAIRTYTRITALQPQLAIGYARLADANVAAGDKSAAAVVLRRGMEAAPGSRLLRQRLVAMSRKGQGGDDALGIAKSIQRSKPADAAGYMAEGDILADRKQWAAAAASYRRAAEAPTGELLAAPKAHAAMYAAGDKTSADAFAAVWLKSHPKDAVFRAHLGARAIASGDPAAMAAAERYLKEAVTLDPKHVQALNNLAWLMSERAAKGGMSYAKQAVALAPGNAVLLDTLAKTQLLEASVDEAIETQRAAVSIAPQTPALRMNLAKLYVKAGRKAEALAELDTLAKDTTFKRQDEVQQLRKSLGA
jgi:cellulose synthase operon protein C